MKKYMLICTLHFLTAIAYAQADPGMPGGDPDVPLDGGIALLILAGAGYGAKKIKQAYGKEQRS